VVASCKHISSTKSRKYEELFKLMNDVGIIANGVKLGVRIFFATIRVVRLHSSLRTGVTEQTTNHTGPP